MSVDDERISNPTLKRVQTSARGYVFRLPQADTDRIQKHIAQTSSFYELSMLEHASALVREGDLVLDVGACIGNHSLYFAGECGAKVVAFEPNPIAFQQASENIELNDLAGEIDLRPVGLGSDESLVVNRQTLSDNLGSNQLIKADTGELRLHRLDDLVLPLEPRLIKIDVEGMELDVLRGGASTIARCRPYLYVECGDIEALSAVVLLLSSWDYVPLAQFNSTPTLYFAPLGARPSLLHEQVAFTTWSMERGITRVANEVRKSSALLEERIGVLSQQLGETLASVKRLERSAAEDARRQATAELQAVQLLRIERELHTLKLRLAEQPAAPRPRKASPSAPVERAKRSEPKGIIAQLERATPSTSHPNARAAWQGALASLRSGSSELEVVRRKARKLSRDPEAFFSDSKHSKIADAVSRVYFGVTTQKRKK